LATAVPLVAVPSALFAVTCNVPALMVVDPFPNTATIVKASLFKVPIVRWFLEQWQAIPVERQGRDSAGVRVLLRHVRSGGVLAVADASDRMPEKSTYFHPKPPAGLVMRDLNTTP